MALIHPPSANGISAPAFGERLIRSCQTFGSNVAIRLMDDDLSYERVYRAVMNYAVRLDQHGVGRQSLVLIHTLPEHGMVSMIIRLALAVVGAPWSSFKSYKLDASQNSKMRWTHVVSTAAPETVPFDPVIFIDGSWNSLSVDQLQRLSPVFSGYQPGDVVFFAETSGTTGQPRLVLRTLEEVEQQLTPGDLATKSVSSLFSYTADRGFWRLTSTLMSGGIIIEGPSFNQDDRRPDLVLGSNLQVETWLKRQEKPPLRSHRLPMLFPMGSVISSRDISLYLQFFEEVIVSYAGTEMGRVAETRVREELTEPYLSYAIEKDVEVQVVNDRKEILPRGEEGEVRVLTPRIKQFKARGDRIAVSGDGWFYPGDHGILTADGRLVITGRHGDALNVLGVKLAANQIDETLEGIQGVRNATAFVFRAPDSPSQLAALIVPTAGIAKAELAGRIREKLGRMGSTVSSCLLFFVKELPTNQNGKVMRRLCAEVARHLKPD